MAIATRRSRSSRRPARSASSWIATRPASSPTSRWSSSRSSPAAAISRSSTAPCPRLCARSATTRSRSPTSSLMRSAARRSRMRRASTTPRSRPRACRDEAIDKVEAALGGAFDIRFVFNKWTLGVETLEQGAQDPARALRRAGLRSSDRARLHQGPRSRPPTASPAAR